MFFQRPIFATFALSYCVCLGFVALYQDRRSRLNRLFAFYNFSNAFFNLGDYVLFIKNHQAALWFYRLTYSAGSVMLPFLMLFVFELTGAQRQTRYRSLGKAYLVAGTVLAALCLTPWLMTDVNYGYLQDILHIEVPGPLFSLFAVFILSGLVIILFSLPAAWKIGSASINSTAATSWRRCSRSTAFARTSERRLSKFLNSFAKKPVSSSFAAGVVEVSVGSSATGGSCGAARGGRASASGNPSGTRTEAVGA